MKIGEIMTDKVVSISQMEPVSAAARLMKRHNLGALPVCDDGGRLRGMITDRDIVTRCVAADLDAADTQVREIMSRGICTCGCGEDVQAAVIAMRTEQVRRLPVLEEGRLVGMLSLGDLARSQSCHMEAAEALTEISANIHRR